MAIYHREKTNVGQAIDVSLFDVAFFATQSVGTLLLYAISGEIRRQIGNLGFHSYNGCFKTKDQWVQITTATNSIWRRFVKAIGKEDLIHHPKMKNDMDRFYHASLIDPIVNKWMEQRTADEVVSILKKARIPCSILKTVDQLLSDPQVEAREMIKLMNYPEMGEIPVPGVPVKLSVTPGSINIPSPKLGEHNKEVYCGLLGFSSQKISRLKREGVI